MTKNVLSKQTETPIDGNVEHEHNSSSSDSSNEMQEIRTQVSDLLELTQKRDTKVTPKEINQQLETLLADYEKLTLQFAQRRRAVDVSLQILEQNGAKLSTELH